MSDHWDDYFNQEKAPPDFLVERVDVVGEGALADQLAKLAETGIHDGSSSCAGLMKELCRRTG